MKPLESTPRLDDTIMSVIMAGGVLFVVLIATGAALLYFAG